MKLVPSAILLASIDAASSSPSVTIDQGIIQGGQCANGGKGVYYKSIPYAEPPVGDLRFEPPKAYNEQYPNGKLDATTPARACIQFGTEFVAQGTKDEDCLYLDIWTPSDATEESALPVKVFVYGGSNTDGGISDSLYDGCNLATEGVVLVSINYRLGPLGFMALQSAGIHGNQGIQDLLLGLEWVQKRISAFGGDPKKVVLFGESAGATDVYALATLPQAPSLFNGAIAESIALPSLLASSALEKAGVSLARTLGCAINDKSCLKSKSAADIKKAFSSDKFLKTGIGSSPGLGVDSTFSHKFWPYVDGKVITENPMTRGVQVPTIFGYNQQEGIMDTLAKYNTLQLATSATPAQYTEFIQRNFGPAAPIIEKYYSLSLFKDQTAPVLAAIATVITDSEFKCPGYQSAVVAARKNMPAWMYEFTHNSTCVWLDTMEQQFIEVYGAAHTAELPYVFGNLRFDFPNTNTNCTGTQQEMNLSKQITSLWTAMAENADPSTGDIHWPKFQASSDLQTPGMTFANSSVPGSIDFSVCKLWTKVFDMLSKSDVASNATSNATVTLSARPSATAVPSGTAKPNESPFSVAATILPTAGGLVALANLLTALAAFF